MATILDSLRTGKRGTFEARPYYSAEGDSLTFFFENKPYYGARIDNFLTVYRALEGDGLIGCQIKGLPKALRLLGDFGLMIKDERVLLTMIFMAFMAQTREEEPRKCYEQLGRIAKERNAFVPAEELSSLIAA